jgi:hypothetical protein
MTLLQFILVLMTVLRYQLLFGHVINVHTNLDSHGFNRSIHTIVFPFLAKDLYTGCQPVFVPSSSVMELRGIIMLESEEKMQLVSVLRLTPAKVVVVAGLCTSAATIQFKNPLLW